jgi:hypothetical protein
MSALRRFWGNSGHQSAITERSRRLAVVSSPVPHLDPLGARLTRFRAELGCDRVPHRKNASAARDLRPDFRTTDKLRDWLPIRREQCGKVVLRKSRWLRSSGRPIAIPGVFRPIRNGSALKSARSKPKSPLSPLVRPTARYTVPARAASPDRQIVVPSA